MPIKEIPACNFYNKRKTDSIRVINIVRNSNSSDIDDLEITDQDSDVDSQSEYNAFITRHPHPLEDLSSDSEEQSSDDEDIPLIHMAGPNTLMKCANQQRTWFQEKDNAYAAGNPPPFLGQNMINIDGDTPYSFFIKLFTEDIFQMIAYETNLYAIQSGKENLSVSVGEIKQFFAINMMMTYIKYPAYRMYWSSTPGLRFEMIADAMSLKRYEEIKRYLHFTNNLNIPDDNKDSFIKIRPLLDKLSTSFAEAAEPTEFLSIDEMIIPFKGRHRMKQYIKSKPKKWGFKVWVRASANGYVSKFKMYQSADKSTVSNLGVIGDTVMRLCQDIVGKNHKIFMDNLFTSIPTINSLKTKDIYVVGTIRTNRLQGAGEKLVDTKVLLKTGRGSSSVATSSDNISVIRWSDNKIVHMISSFCGQEPQDSAQRWDRKTKKHVEVSRPQCIIQYNRFMGGVDMTDRMVAHYPHGVKFKKYYMRIVYHFLNVATVNAWLLFKEKKNLKMSLLDFKASVAATLIQLNQGGKKRGRPSSQAETSAPSKKKAWVKTAVEIRTNNVGHYPMKKEYKNPPRCHDKNCKKRTRYACKKCNEPVCPECMEEFHR